VALKARVCVALEGVGVALEGVGVCGTGGGGVWHRVMACGTGRRGCVWHWRWRCVALAVRVCGTGGEGVWH
jgi:hypothetical protein